MRTCLRVIRVLALAGLGAAAGAGGESPGRAQEPTVPVVILEPVQVRPAEEPRLVSVPATAAPPVRAVGFHSPPELPHPPALNPAPVHPALPLPADGPGEICPGSDGMGAERPGGFDFSKVPPVSVIPPLGYFLLQPTGPGYYSL